MVGIHVSFFPFSLSLSLSEVKAADGKKKASAAVKPPALTAPYGRIKSLVSSHYPPVSPRFSALWSTAILSHGGERLDISNSPEESEALHLCNHRQLVPSDYVPLNAVLSTVAHGNTERD